MTDEALELECRLRFIDLCAGNLLCKPPTGVDLFIEGFWAAVDALRNPRDDSAIESLIALAKARAEGLIK